MAKRNPNSDNQVIMSVLFGDADAANQSTDWKKWPEPQRSIYSRLLRKRLHFTSWKLIKEIKTIHKLLNTLDNY